MTECRVLLVDDDEDDQLIVRDLLGAQQRIRFDVNCCADYEDALVAIAERQHDVYLIDYRLGGHTGLELVRQAFPEGPHSPVILLTGQGDYEVDLEATALGVAEYLTKQGLDAIGLERTIRYAISHHRALADLARSEERYALVVRAANDGIFDWDLQAEEMYLSPRWHVMLGLPDGADETHPADLLDRVHPDDRPRLQRAIDAHLVGTTAHLEVEHRMRHADGSWRWVRTRGLAIRDADGTPTRMAGSISDITERRAAERQLAHDAFHDHLTGLPNRALLMDRLEQALQRAERDTGIGCAVLFVDVDRFKVVNDGLGHAVGDQLLVALAGRFQNSLVPGDTVGRIGGDEFAFVLDSVKTESDALRAVARVHRAMAEPIRIAGQDLHLTASVGVSLCSPDASAADLLRNADIAMYDAKRRGNGSDSVFDPSMHQRVLDQAVLERELRHALEQSLIAVHYQPIVSLATGRLCELEALARWPEGWPSVPPLGFIPIAEETGLISALGMYVLRTALQELVAWRQAGLVDDDVCMSVNISKRQLDDPKLPEQLLEAITEASLPAGALRLEITESTLMQEPERMQRIVSDVCAKGVGLHLDDFGTGYSSLTALQQFPVNALKIDRSFVTSFVGGDGGNDAIVRSTIALAHNLGLEVIAEGIERRAELDRLRELGCEYGQGYL
ncbi:MAG: putative bifunctional diguanylate cyclase/phosphodiesterase, partial [Solirubrobacteraceae bacterium]